MKRFLRKYRRQKRPKVQDSPDLVVFQPRKVPEDKIVRQIGSLEGVPVEVQQIILHQMPNFSTLQALISASPAYLRAYLSQRRSIMSDILHRSIHPDVLRDALAIGDALKVSRNYDDYVPNLKAFAEQYKTTKASLNVDFEPLEPNTTEELWNSICWSLMSLKTSVIMRCPPTQSQVKVWIIIHHSCQTKCVESIELSTAMSFSLVSSTNRISILRSRELETDARVDLALLYRGTRLDRSMTKTGRGSSSRFSEPGRWRK